MIVTVISVIIVNLKNIGQNNLTILSLLKELFVSKKNLS